MPVPSALPADLRHALGVAASGERVLWSGQPRAKRMAAAFGIWLFALPWTAFALFWESMALQPWLAEKPPESAIETGFLFVFPLFGLPFILIGLAMLATPFWTMARAGRTVHALTERRLLTVTVLGRKTSVVAVALDRTGPIEATIRANGSGALSVQTGTTIDSDGDRQTERFVISGVDDVVTLERELRRLQARR